jgi:uridine phosphorylase
MSVSPEPVLVCFALREEARPFEKLAGHRPHLRVLLTGMGPVNARRAVRAALAAARPAAVLSCGFAGGLDPALARGDVVFTADPARVWRERLLAAGAKPVKFHCAERIAATAAEKRRLRQSTGADAVEMESGAIEAECRRHGLPCATVRVISDTADEDLPVDFNRFLGPDQRLALTRLLGALVRQPGLLPALLELRRTTRAAAQRLAAVLAAVTVADPPSAGPAPRR